MSLPSGLPTHRPRVSPYGPDKARRLLDYRTTVSLRDGLQSMVDWVRMNGPREFQYHLPIEIDSELVPDTWKKRMI